MEIGKRITTYTGVLHRVHGCNGWVESLEVTKVDVRQEDREKMVT